MPLGSLSAPLAAAAYRSASGALVVSQYESRAANACGESLPSADEVSGAASVQALACSVPSSSVRNRNFDDNSAACIAQPTPACGLLLHTFK